MVVAAESRDMIKVPELLKMGAKTSAMDPLLIAAVRAKNVDDVKWFLDLSANKDAKDEVVHITNTDY